MSALRRKVCSRAGGSERPLPQHPCDGNVSRLPALAAENTRSTVMLTTRRLPEGTSGWVRRWEPERCPAAVAPALWGLLSFPSDDGVRPRQAICCRMRRWD